MQLLQTRGIEKTSTPFREGLIALGEKLNINPNYLAAVMANESGFRPWIKNPIGGATGLIQWMPRIAPLYGTTTDALKCMTDVEQLEYVEKFYKPYRGKIDSPGTAYMVTFLPAFAFKPDDFVLGRKDDQTALYGKTTLHMVWRDNRLAFDPQSRGYFTVADVKKKANATYAAAQARGPIPLSWPYVSAESTRGEGCPKAEAGGAGSGTSSSSSASEPPATWRSVGDVEFPDVTEVDRIPGAFWKPIQIDLERMGLYHGRIDGDPGPKTMTALARVGLDALR